MRTTGRVARGARGRLPGAADLNLHYLGGRAIEHLNPALAAHDEAVDSKHGLGGYHGSIHAKRGSTTDTVLRSS